jgi:uncharacterized protein (DUF1810 family)
MHSDFPPLEKAVPLALPKLNNNFSDPYNLDRFVEAQANVYELALVELKQGRKRSQWIWFIFPQVAGLGSSCMSQIYAIGSRGETGAYLAHPVLGPRLVECAEAVLRVEGRSAREIMGSPDDLKLQSSMTLFAEVATPGSVFEQVLDKLYAGEWDRQTLEFLF